MPVLDSIARSCSGAVVRRCADKGCTLRLENLTRHLIIKGERICERKICDCIIFVELDHVAIVELKGKTARRGQVKEKLINGADSALEILGRCNVRTSPNLCFVVLCKAWRISEYREITSIRVRIRGTKYSILAKRCGVRLAQLLQSRG